MASSNIFNKGKKASIDVQFNWIFVLVIGALIIIFFISVMKSSEKTSTQATYQSVGVSLKNLISQIESDDKNSRNIKIPNIVINLDCEDLEVEKSGSTESLKYKTIFSPNKVKGRNLLAYTANFNMPYPVDNFIFLTSNEVRYNFINNSCTTLPCQAMLKEIIKLLPVNSTYKIVPDSSSVTDNNNYKERFVFFNEPLGGINAELNYLKGEVTAVRIDGDLKSGKIYYYKQSGSTFGPSSPGYDYLGASMLAGAVLSDEDIFTCNKDKALIKYKIMTTIYSNRTKIFKDAYNGYDLASSERNCYDIYNSIHISDILTQLNSGTPNFQTIAGISNSIKTSNEKSVLESCPSIY